MTKYRPSAARDPENWTLYLAAIAIAVIVVATFIPNQPVPYVANGGYQPDPGGYRYDGPNLLKW